MEKAAGATLEPRQSFKVWSETMVDQLKIWTNDQLENTGILTLVYGKFIEIWRHKESHSKHCRTKSTHLSNAAYQSKEPS